MIEYMLLYVHCLILLTYSDNTSEVINEKPNVIISTDIGGSDPDDYQSMVHLLVYAHQMNIVGLISSPPHQGRKEHIEEVIKAYSKDYKKLAKHSREYPNPEYLLSVTIQGATDSLSNLTPESLSEGAHWIVKQANESKNQPVYILVWGSITDVAEAVHYEPSIKKNIRVYSIGSWNTKLDVNSRNYLYNNHSDLWWIENNTTFRGMYMGGYQSEDYGNLSFVENHVKGHGALGNLFWEKKKDIKMGDTPSVLYFLNGDVTNPESSSWGGAFIKTNHGPNYWTDNPVDSLKTGDKSGAKTVNIHRKEYLDDWAQKMSWLK